MSFEGQNVVVEVASTQSFNEPLRLQQTRRKWWKTPFFGKPEKCNVSWSCPPVKRTVCWFCYVLLISGGSKNRANEPRMLAQPAEEL